MVQQDRHGGYFYTEFHFECPQCHHNFCEIYQCGKLVNFIDMKTLPVKRAGKEQRGTSNDVIHFFNPNRFQTLPNCVRFSNPVWYG